MAASTSSVTRAEVLQLYRILMRTKRKVFEGDQLALEAVRKKIREEFVKNKDEKDPKKLVEHLQLGYEVDKVLRTSVIQARRTPSGHYQLQLRDEVLSDNTPYQER